MTSLQSDSVLNPPSVKSSRVDGQSYMSNVDEALGRVNNHKCWVLGLFLLCCSAGTLNAYHIMVSNFYAFVPPHWCRIEELENANWAVDRIRAISKPNSTDESTCSVVGWNYTQLAAMGYEKALQYVESYPHPLPSEVACSHFTFQEDVPYSTVVSEWDLVCEKKFFKSSVQGSIALGKLSGGFLFGFLGDRFGRKSGFCLASLMYAVFGPLAAFSPNYWFFIVNRFLIGIAGSGCYETGITILMEMVTKERRAPLGCMYNLSYPFGYITLPGLSLLFPQWRYLQLAISLPALLFVIHWWFLPESPRWLVTQGRLEQAWKIINKVDPSLVPDIIVEESLPNVRPTLREKFINLFNRKIGGSQKVKLILSSPDTCLRLITILLPWFSVALVYYVLALNAVNFGLEQHMYTFVSGFVEIPGYILPTLMLLWVGRKWTSCILFFISGAALVTTLFLSKSQDTLILIAALLGRYADVAVYALITVYTTELFPTVVRNTALGISFGLSQIGSISAPYVVDNLDSYGWYMPSFLCGLLALMSALLVLVLPETRGRPLLDTIEQAKQSRDRVTFRNCCRVT